MGKWHNPLESCTLKGKMYNNFQAEGYYFFLILLPFLSGLNFIVCYSCWYAHPAMPPLSGQ